MGRNDGARYVARLVNLSRGRSARRVEKEARVRPRGSAVALSKASARDRSLIGKSPSDYEAWKPSRRARGALRARGDSFQSVDEGAGSGSNSSLLRKIRSPDNCDLSSRKGNPERGDKNERTRKTEREGRKRRRKVENPRRLLVSIPSSSPRCT